MSEYLERIFLFSKAAPLIFTQFYFWVFFAIVMAAYTFVANKRWERSAFVFLVSLFFYYKSSGNFFFILIFTTLLDYSVARLIYSAGSLLKRRLLLAASVTINLSLLAYFKYAYFFTDTFNQVTGQHKEVLNFLALWANEATGTHFQVNQILLPVGISFFTFQSLSYTIDVYKGKLKPLRSFLDYGFFVSFFPQLVAGPIVRASEFIPQIFEKYRLSRYEFGLAVFMILKGLTKKIFIGDYIAVNFVDRVFADPITKSGFENLMAIIGYSLQVYVDFSGYTDIAIGVSLLMGFRLTRNFNSPYKALNVADFWKRWHISLSTWLKDYLYIPLGGNRKGSIASYIVLGVIFAFIAFLARMWWLILVFVAISLVLAYLARLFPKIRQHLNTNLNLMLTMLIGGLWHGASWQFVIWGGLNGAGLVVYKYWRKISPWELSSHWAVRVWRIALTFAFITFTRIFFRSETMEIASAMMHQIGNELFRIESLTIIPAVIIGYYKVFLMMLFGFVTHWLPDSFKDRWRDKFIAAPTWAKVALSSLAVFIIYQSVSAGMQPFIYFQF
jgi:alginate O-acetyltransferase complex protein AlgI